MNTRMQNLNLGERVQILQSFLFNLQIEITIN